MLRGTASQYAADVGAVAARGQSRLCRVGVVVFFFKQKTAYVVTVYLEFRRVLFRSVERAMVAHLVAAGHIVVACGGGGPPVYDDPVLRLEGIDAVVDKDRVAAVLGREIGAEVLLILTNVDAVYRRYGTKHQEPIRRLDLAGADHLLTGEELGTGSMRPKVEAAADFVRAGGRRAVIAELAQGLSALRGESGTTITGNGP